MYHLWILFVLSLTISMRLSAQEKIDIGSSSFFKDNYISVGAVSNFPTIKTNQVFSYGYPNIRMDYEYFALKEWIGSLGFSDKVFRDKRDNSILSIFTVHEAFYKLILLHHPLYLKLGGELDYLVPTLGAGISNKSSKDIEPEIGGSLGGALLYYKDKNNLFSFQIMRFRGINTSRIHGFEIVFKSSFGL